MTTKILAVDDDPGILEALYDLLFLSGYDVTTTLDADEIFQKIAEFSPDLILLDIMLSGKDGREICRQLKLQDHTKAIPVILVSATPTTTEMLNSCGANDFVAKPFDMYHLLEKIERHLN